MQWARKQTGFTIVELLIVVVVIAILAAITIVAYNGIQNRAKESAAEQALSQVQKKIALWRVDNAEQLPAALTSLSGLPANGTYEYRRFDNNTQYCLAFTDQNLTYRVYSTQPGAYAQGNCTDITAVPNTSAPLARADRTNRVVSLPSTLSGTPDVTLYAVFDVIDTSSGWEAIAQLRPSVASSSVIQLDMNAAGSDAARYRLDTPSSPNINAAKFGVRTPGRHIGWVQVNTSGTVRTFNYDGAASYHSAAFTPGVGWNFTGFGIGGDTTGTQPVFGVVYTQAHDEQTRARVMQWLSDTYSVGATY